MPTDTAPPPTDKSAAAVDSSSLSELNALSAENEKAEAAEKAGKTPPAADPKTPPKAATATPKTAEPAKAAAPPADPKAADPKAAPAEPPPTAQQSNFAKIKQKAEHAESELAKAQTELKELKERLAKGTVPKEVQDELEMTKQERIELREKLAKADWKHSKDYQDNYWQPYVETWSDAITSAMGLTFINASGQPQKLTKDEADTLMNYPESKMREEAEKLFGVSSNLLVLIDHQRAVKACQNKLAKGEATAKQRLAEEKEREGLTKKEQGEKIKALWQSTNEELAKTELWFQESEDDKEGSELLKKGLAEADRAFSDDPELSAEDRLKIHATMRLRYAGYMRVINADAAKAVRIVELEKSLKEYQESEPTTEGSARPQNGAVKSTLEELRELEALNR